MFNKKLMIVIVSLLVVAGTVFIIVDRQQPSDTEPDSEMDIGQVVKVADNVDKAVVNQQSPDFTFVNSDGQKQKLSDFEDKVIFLNFWASWCPPCRKEMPYMQQIYQEYQEQVKILAVNLQEGETKVKDFIKKNNYNFTVLRDQGQLAARYQVQGIPKSIFIDKNGIIKAQHTGSMTKSMMENAIEKAVIE